MMRWRLVIWATLALLLAVGAFSLLLAPSLTDMHRAKVHYAEARENLEAVDLQQKVLENQVTALRTHIDSIELGARREYRLIKPGEKLEILQVQQ
ncbi:septum formation initiator family protein [bacterium]|nr:septum formation initiator family protein [bacterium]